MKTTVEDMIDRDISVEWFVLGKGIRNFREGSIGKFIPAGEQFFDEHRYVDCYKKHCSVERINRAISRSRDICLGFGGQGVPDYAIVNNWTDVTFRNEIFVYETQGSYGIRNDTNLRVVGYVGKHRNGKYYFRKLKSPREKKPLYVWMYRWLFG